MRIIVDLDLALLRQARKRASAEHCSLSQVMAQAMRHYLTPQSRQEPAPHHLVTAGYPDGKAPTWEALKRQMIEEDEANQRRIAENGNAAP